jgi:O-antigen/teichoic acid export membrane protein
LKKKFIESLGLVLLLNLLVKPFWIFGIDRVVQNEVGPHDYGVYFALFNFSLILNIILDLGLTNYNNRNISQHQFLLSKHLSNIVVLKFLLAIVYFIVTIVIAVILGFDKLEIEMLLFLAFNQFLLSFILYLRSNLAGLHLFKTDSIVSVLDRLLMIAICSLLLWGNVTDQKFQIEWFVYAQTIAYGLTALFVFVLVALKADFLKLKFDITFFRVILKKSLPFALLILLMAFYYRVDSVMLNRMLPEGDLQAGIYAQGFRVLDAATMFAFLFAGLLLPIFSHMIKKKEKVDQIVGLSIMLLFVPVILISVSSYFFRYELMNLLYHHDIQESSPVFGILILALIPIASSYIFGTLLTANGSLKALNILSFSGMILNIVLNLILIPIYQAFGSALASIITQILIAVLQIIISYRIFGFRINYALIIRFTVFVLLIVLVGVVIKEVKVHWIYQFSITLTGGFIFAIIIKLFTFRGLYKILKYDEPLDEQDNIEN